MNLASRLARRPALPALYLAALAALIAALQWAGWERTWRALAVPPMVPVFADMRTVQGALATQAAGRDPQVDNVGDPWRRRMNYPRLWVRLADALDLDREAHYLLALSVCLALFAATGVLLLWRFPSPWLLAALLSWAALLAMERGNNDLPVFVLVAAAALLPPRLPAAALILAATVLKVYPLVASLLLLQARRLAPFLLAAAAGLLYLLGMSAELASIRQGTPVATAMSYGAASIARWLANKSGHAVPVLAVALPLAALALASAWAMRRLPVGPLSRPGGPAAGGSDEPAAEGAAGRLFLAGAAIYLASFLLSGNFDYRLIFLVLCIPWLAGLPPPLLRRSALAAVLLSMNEGPLRAAFGPAGFALNLAAELFCFAVLAGLLGRLLPGLLAPHLPRRAGRRMQPLRIE